ncbi:hypothetical protein MTO96_042663, partial [Rhipicephalus appendiculatus]
METQDTGSIIVNTRMLPACTIGEVFVPHRLFLFVTNVTYVASVVVPTITATPVAMVFVLLAGFALSANAEKIEHRVSGHRKAPICDFNNESQRRPSHTSSWNSAPFNFGDQRDIEKERRKIHSFCKPKKSKT